mmetsp:Transcript_34306/g.98895  ORF Transcript_34306/g.98895 Transcript_34306/m.98895 type:complete len:301 (-) Transcript_34306:596-1498(-)
MEKPVLTRGDGLVLWAAVAIERGPEPLEPLIPMRQVSVVVQERAQEPTVISCDPLVPGDDDLACRIGCEAAGVPVEPHALARVAELDQEGLVALAMPLGVVADRHCDGLVRLPILELKHALHRLVVATGSGSSLHRSIAAGNLATLPVGARDSNGQGAPFHGENLLDVKGQCSGHIVVDHRDGRCADAKLRLLLLHPWRNHLNIGQHATEVLIGLPHLVVDNRDLNYLLHLVRREAEDTGGPLVSHTGLSGPVLRGVPHADRRGGRPAGRDLQQNPPCALQDAAAGTLEPNQHLLVSARC